MTEVKLGDVATIDTGLPFKSAQFSRGNQDIRLLRGDNVSQGRINWSGAARWPSEKEVDVRYEMRAGDVVVAMDRPWVGAGLKRSVIGRDDLPSYLVQRVARLRAKPGLDQGFLRYVIEDPTFLQYLRSVQTGTAIPHISGPQIGEYRFSLPPSQQQRAIAEVLGALDDKIAANTRLARTVDSVLTFEFSARLGRTENRRRKLGIIANVVLGGTPSRARPDYWTNGTIPWLNSGALNATRILEPSEFITVEALEGSAAKLMPSGTTLLAITGATLGQVARLEMPASGNQSIVGVWSDDVDLNTWLYFAIQARLDDLLTRSTGAAQQHVSKRDVEQLGVPLPSQIVLAEFSRTATPLLDLAAVSERESRTLAAIRDALLPQLMSGKLRVRDAEAIAADTGA